MYTASHERNLELRELRILMSLTDLVFLEKMLSISALLTLFKIVQNKDSVGWSERIASKHLYHQVWNRSPVQVGCMRQVFEAGALGWPRGMGWEGRWEGGSGWGIYVNPWLIHVNVWQKPLQYCKVISLQQIKINEKKKELKQDGQY